MAFVYLGTTRHLFMGDNVKSCVCGEGEALMGDTAQHQYFLNQSFGKFTPIQGFSMARQNHHAIGFYFFKGAHKQ